MAAGRRRVIFGGMTRRLLTIIVASLSLLAVTGVTALAGPDGGHTANQLKKVERVTAPFKDLRKAKAAGYVQAGGARSGVAARWACTSSTRRCSATPSWT